MADDKAIRNGTRATFSFRATEIYFSATCNGRGLKERITGRCTPVKGANSIIQERPTLTRWNCIYL